MSSCPRKVKGQFFDFFWGCWRLLWTTRSLTIWIVSAGLIGCPLTPAGLQGIVFLSGPIWDRANRVTQACHLKRIVPKHDRRIGRIGDWTDHLCPCPSILRSALRKRARRTVCRRWQDRSVASDNRDPVAETPPVRKQGNVVESLVVSARYCCGALCPGSQSQSNSSTPFCQRAPRLA